MNRSFLFPVEIAIAIAIAAASPARALTLGAVGTATNVTATSAWLNASCTSTGTSAAYMTLYWGATNGATNAADWQHTNVIGAVTVATYTVQATGLSPSTLYYHRAYATNATETNWADYSAVFITLSAATSAPPASTRVVSVDTNGVLKNPTNFFTANSQQIAQAAAAGGALTNETDPIWGAASNTVLTSIGSLTASVSVLQGEMLDVQAGTTAWNQAAADAASATASVSVLQGEMLDVQAGTTAWNQAAADASSATASVSVLQGEMLDVQAATNALDNRVDALESGTTANRYPVFILDIGNTDGRWTDFIMKASTDNWESSAVYCYKSFDVQPVTHNPDTNAYCYFTDDCAADPRKWLTKTNDISIADHLTNDPLARVNFVYFAPSHDCTWETWMQETNANLVWSYVRYDDGTYETNDVNQGIRWNLVEPSWEANRKQP
jgi:hypothetical protein